MQIYTKVLSLDAQALVLKLSSLLKVNNFYLSGGTALALQMGHRKSEDLDFFTIEDFNPQTLQMELEKISLLKDTTIDIGTLNTFINNIKVQFLHYPYKLLEQPVLWNGIQISSIIDIACTKLITISMRGSKKDFVDLYIILKQYPLEELFKRLDEKYKNVDYNHTHILKSLIFFADADQQSSPNMYAKLDWDEVKSTITTKVKAFKI